MPDRVTRKWRPRLGLVLACTLAVVLCLPVLGLLALRAGCPSGYLPGQGCASAAIPVALLTLSATAMVGYVLWRILLGPITALAERAHRIKSGEASALAPLDRYGTAEMSEMGQAMLDMGRVLAARETMLRSYSDHVTHELKSPLTVLRGAAELLDTEGLSEADRKALLTRIHDAAARMTALLDAQRAFARAQDPADPGPSDLSAMLTALRPDFPRLSITSDDGAVPLGATALRLVLTQLFSNSSAHGATSLHLSLAPSRLDITDNGPGISAGNRAQIFEPFFTTRRSGDGTGMGLPIVRRTLEAHGASITLIPTETGARFRITF